MSKTDEFIRQSKERHGDKYDYSRTEYVGNLKEVIIGCKEHGEFRQLPKTHKRGAGCVECGRISRGNLRKSSTDEFIEKARGVHGDRYDYSKVNYTFAREPVTIICKVHGAFEQTPNGHLSKGAGCVKCATQINADKQRKTKEQFIDAAKIIHGDRYEYSKVNYIAAIEKVVILCKHHGPFEQTPNSHLSKESGCVKCAGIYKSNTEEFITKAIKIHGDRYDYSNVNYTTVIENIIILCKDHGAFKQTPNNHLNGQGCSKCGHNMYIFSTDDFKRHAYQTHGDTYDYAESEYLQMNQKLAVRCKIHGLFEQTPSNHITHKQGCGKCHRQYSSMQIRWLNFVQKYDAVNIEHAENGGEFHIPGTRYKADGYCRETNTIYEFHGDLWHGNPKIYNAEEVSYFGKTYGELYQKTVLKETKIKELEFNLVVMWENEWNRINRIVRILQRNILKKR